MRYLPHGQSLLPLVFLENSLPNWSEDGVILLWCGIAFFLAIDHTDYSCADFLVNCMFLSWDMPTYVYWTSFSGVLSFGFLIWSRSVQWLSTLYVVNLWGSNDSLIGVSWHYQKPNTFTYFTKLWFWSSNENFMAGSSPQHKKLYKRIAALGTLGCIALDIRNMLGSFNHKGEWYSIIFSDLMALEMIILKEIGQAQKDKHNMVSLMWDTKEFIYWELTVEW